MLSNGDIQEDICLSLLDKALEGDVSAFKLIRDTIGEKPNDKINMTDVHVNLTKSYNEVKILLEAERQRAINNREMLLLDDIED